MLLGKDNDALLLLLGLHAMPNPIILDCTYNKGTMWDGTGIKPMTNDIDPQFGTDYVADFRDMMFAADEAYDVLVFDPPHLPTHAASPQSSGIWEQRYGITANGEGREGDNVTGLFKPFLKEAKRVLKRWRTR